MSTSIVKSYDSVCDAIKDVHDEASLWHLSDEIIKIAPAGVEAVDRVVEQAKARGIPVKSSNTLRLYRDVAIRFPATERVPLVSFSAHREALVLGNSADARKLLLELVKQHTAEGVTVTTVKTAVGAKTGNVKAPTAAGKGKAATAAALSHSDIALDLCQGGKKFISSLDAMLAVNGVSLDAMHTGLTAVLTELEVRRSKAARKASAAKRPAPVVNPKQSPAARKAVEAARNMGKAKSSGKATPTIKGGKRGDLRDL
jgi:hypothetical protein